MARQLVAVAHLSDAAAEALATAAEVHGYTSGQQIIAQGQTPTHLHILLRGRAKMCRELESGRSVILSLFAPGDSFATSAMGQTEATSSIFSLGIAECATISPAHLFGLLSSQPSLIAELFPYFTHGLAECRNCLVEMTGSRVDGRLATLFVRLGNDAGETTAAGLFVPIRLTRQELADLAGTTIESAIRTMSRWHKAGLLETHTNGFLLRDLDALRRITTR